MNHLQTLGLPLARLIGGDDGIFAWWQVGLFVLLIGLVVMLVVIRKRQQ